MKNKAINGGKSKQMYNNVKGKSNNIGFSHEPS
jgi:hypothetical protein